MVLVENFVFISLNYIKVGSGVARNFHLGGGYSLGSMGDGSPSGSRDEAPVEGLGTKSPRSWSTLQKLFTDFDFFDLVMTLTFDFELEI